MNAKIILLVFQSIQTRTDTQTDTRTNTDIHTDTLTHRHTRTSLTHSLTHAILFHSYVGFIHSFIQGRGTSTCELSFQVDRFNFDLQSH